MVWTRTFQPLASSSKLFRPSSASARKPLRFTCFRCSSTTTPPRPPYEINGQTYLTDSHSNVPPSILAKLDRNLHLQPSHPIAILRSIVESHFSDFTAVRPESAIVTVEKNFDELGFAPDHPGRALTDSYYLNKKYMLRTHTSAHEVETYASGLDKWLLSADVYRRDEIDSSHYPVFHQMEGTHVWPEAEVGTIPRLNEELAAKLAECPLVIEDETKISASNPYQPHHDPEHAAQITQHLKHSLNSLIFRLFGHVATQGGEPLRVRWVEAFFPFTTPSYEVEVWWNGEWLELLGCGVVMQNTLDQARVSNKAGWAFGLGLERLCMVLFSIPDIRLFWSTDPRFLSQFQPGQISTFKPYSKYPPVVRDMSFWIPDDIAEATGEALPEGKREWHENDYCEIVRDIARDLIENVQLLDEFTHPKTNRRSKTYRLTYRSMDRNLLNDEITVLHNEVERRTISDMGIEMR